MGSVLTTFHPSVVTGSTDITSNAAPQYAVLATERRRHRNLYTTQSTADGKLLTILYGKLIHCSTVSFLHPASGQRLGSFLFDKICVINHF